jgi:hypothetical protein
MGREYVGMRINPEILKAVDALAKGQNRNRSNTIEWVLFEWFREHRPELIKPAIKEAARLALSYNMEESYEGISLLAAMPGGEVLDAIDDVLASEQAPEGETSARKPAPEPAKPAKKPKK